jgi:Shoulder domain
MRHFAKARSVHCLAPMTDRDVRERDILVASNEYAYVQDLTKGDIVLYVGPTKISLSNTERLVDLKSDRFVPVRGDDKGDGGVGVSPFLTASSSQYIILENPPRDPGARPLKGSNASIELLVGRKVVVPGPVTFPLWPGQKAKVIDGHKLRERDYLIVRVYDAIDGETHPIGTELVIRGSDTSFYIPRTGLEVVPGDQGYVRKAWRLTKNTGLHVRVVKPYVAAEGDQLPPGVYPAGAEVFLRDKEGFFFPSESLEVKGIVFAMPIAEKEGLYVRDIETGRIQTVAGPCSYLRDPTKVEVIDRALPADTAQLYGLGPGRGLALSIYIPPSYAVLVTAKSKREVVKGPQTRILAYDEELEVLRLSTGRPKSDEALLPTCFLQIEGNKVSDVVRVKTADHVELEVSLSYRVSFVTRGGEPERWFNVRNYVGLLCDHLGSILRAAARSTSIDVFHASSTEILRTAVLGEKRGIEPREGRYFEENGMWVYDVEVLDVRILDEDVKKLMIDAQRMAIHSEVSRRQQELRLQSEKLREEVDREVYGAQIETLAKAVELEGARERLMLAQAGAKMELHKIEQVSRARNEAEAYAIATEARVSAAEKEAGIERARREVEVAAFKEQMAALHPELVATLKMLGNQHLAAELSKNVSPLAILGGDSVTAVLEKLIGALPVGPAPDGTVKKVLAMTPKSKA